jgi:hypothetical protein
MLQTCEIFECKLKEVLNVGLKDIMKLVILLEKIEKEASYKLKNKHIKYIQKKLSKIIMIFI